MVVRRAAYGWLVLLVLVLTSITLLPRWVAGPPAPTVAEMDHGNVATTAAGVYDGRTQHRTPDGGSGATVTVAAVVRDRSSPIAARAAVVAAPLFAAEGLTGVPRAPMDRALARLDGLRVGDKRVVQSVDAFGSRAGSTFRGRGPTASSDLDLLLRTDPALMSSRSGPWIDDVLGKISKDFEAEAGFPLSLHRPGLPDVFASSLKGTPLVRVFDRVG